MPNLSGHMGRILLITLIVLAVILLLLFTSNKPGVISLIHDPMLYHEDSNQLIVHTSRIRRENVSKPGNFYIEQYKNTQDNTYHIISAETGEIIHSINAYTGPSSAFIAEDTLYIVNNYSPLKSTDQDSTRVASLSANQLDPFQELFTAEEFYKDHLRVSTLMDKEKPGFSLENAYYFQGTDGQYYQLDLCIFHLTGIDEQAYKQAQTLASDSLTVRSSNTLKVDLGATVTLHHLSNGATLTLTIPTDNPGTYQFSIQEGSTTTQVHSLELQAGYRPFVIEATDQIIVALADHVLFFDMSTGDLTQEINLSAQ